MRGGIRPLGWLSFKGHARCNSAAGLLPTHKLSEKSAILHVFHSAKLRAATVRNHHSMLKNESDTPQTSFARDYLDPHNMVQDFVEYATSCLLTFKSSTMVFNSPYCAVTQSSGWGKSRLLRQVADHVPTMYINMGKDRLVFPRPTQGPIVALFGDQNYHSVGQALNFIGCRLAIVEQAAYRLPRVVQSKDHKDSDPNHRAFFPSQQDEHVWKFVEDAKAFEHPSGEPCAKSNIALLVIDEARALLDYDMFPGITLFHLLRRALRDHHLKHRGSKLFLVLIDTNTQISKFSPSLGKDPPDYQMLIEPGGPRLFHPYIIRNSYDVFFRGLKDGTTDLSSLSTSLEYLNSGRPLIGMKSRRFDDGRLHPNELHLLLGKLLGGSRKLVPSSCLSLLLCRLSVSINGHHPLATKLVADHMATLLALDSDCGALVAYVAEPNLAMAGALFWTEPEFVKVLLPALNRAVISGTVDAGECGELVAQIMILKAFDKAGGGAGRLVKVEDLLTALLPVGDETKVLSAIPSHLQNSHVSCTQFVKKEHRLSVRTMQLLGEKKCGAVCQDRQSTVNIVIPILATLATLNFQVKLGQDVPHPSDDTSRFCVDMMPSLGFANDKFTDDELKAYDTSCVRVHLSLAAAVPSASCEDTDVVAVKDLEAEKMNAATQRKAVHKRLQLKADIFADKRTKPSYPLQIFGIGAVCLTNDERAALKAILKARKLLHDFVKQDLEERNEKFPRSPHPDSIQKVKSRIPFVIDRDRDWSDLTVEDLHASCQKFSLSGTTKLNKQELIDALKKAGKTLEE